MITFFLNVLPVIVILFIVCCVNLVRKYKKKPNINLYRWINISVYLIEIYITTTVINFLINHKTFMEYGNPLDLLHLVSDFILAFTIYQFLINIILQIWDGVVIDGYISMKRVANLFLLQLKNKPDCMNDQLKNLNDKLTNDLRADCFNADQRKIVKEIQFQIENYVKGELSTEGCSDFLERTLLDIEHSIEFLNLRWQSSLFLKLLK